MQNIKLNLFSILFLLSLSITMHSCLEAPNTYSGLPPGIWRGILKLDYTPPVNKEVKAEDVTSGRLKIEEVPEGELPFNFEVKYITKDSFILEFRNADERIVASNIKFGRDIRTAKDTLYVEFPEYDSYISAICKESVIEGKFVIRTKENSDIKFVAYQGKDYRFSELKKTPIADVSGDWEVYFGQDSTDIEKAIGRFSQNGNYLSGTFLTETGDYRFMEGTVQGNKLYLSCFDGSHCFLIAALITDKDHIEGNFRSGKTYKTTWKGTRNSKASLSDPYAMNKILNADANFQWMDDNNQKVTLADPQFEGKIKLVQIMGTWCPNCKDETNFLNELVKTNKDVAVIGVAFEKYDNATKAYEHIGKYKKALKVDYPIYFGGKMTKENASNAFPQIDGIKAFPTLLVIDKNNKIRKVHTGFNGPATGKYETFKVEFNEMLLQLNGK
ncbi:MAG: TlpA family protein disulfide reductase [Saprospiraceae bacterium]|nr:TlpA family protein disulfide reductase [Saprospiraceae bacterium]